MKSVLVKLVYPVYRMKINGKVNRVMASLTFFFYPPPPPPPRISHFDQFFEVTMFLPPAFIDGLAKVSITLHLVCACMIHGPSVRR